MNKFLAKFGVIIFLSSTVHAQWQLDTKYTIDLTFDRLEALSIQKDSAVVYKFYISTSNADNFLNLKDSLSRISVSSKVLHNIEHQTLFQLEIADSSIYSRETLYDKLLELRDISIAFGASLSWTIESTDSDGIIPNLNQFQQKLILLENSVLYNQGKQLMNFGYYKYAILVYEECIARNYLADSSCIQLAGCYSSLGNRSNAIIAFQRAVTFNPKSTLFYILLGQEQYLNTDFKQSIASFEKALKLDSNNESALLYKARSLFDLKEYKSSKKQFVKLHRMYPENQGANYYLNKLKEMGL